MGGPGPGIASQALLISPPDAVPPRGSGVRSEAHFTCGWVRISICSASAPRRAVPCSPPPPPLPPGCTPSFQILPGTAAC